MTACKRKKRKQVRLGRLRTSVRKVNTIYGLLVQAHDALRGDVLDLTRRVYSLERTWGLKWTEQEERHVPSTPRA